MNAKHQNSGGGQPSAGSFPTMVPGREADRPASILPEALDYASIGSMKTMRGRMTPRGERLRPGDVLLGRYTVVSELGEGGMGIVYKCLDSVGGIEVAVKVLPPELSRNESEMEGIRENYGIVARLHHSAISGLRQLEKDKEFGEYYLVMDLAEGDDLSAVLRRRKGEPMPHAEALAILRPVASALDYAHAEKVLHRDVKPGNVKVAGWAQWGGGLRTAANDQTTQRSNDPTTKRPNDQTTLRVQLLDFGLAAEVRSSMSRVSMRGHAGTSGTPAYMAPEQWEAMRQSAATDQYALAVMAYQMLAGYLPFDADDTDLLRRAVLSRAPRPVKSLPRGANAALMRALAKEPAARFPSCGAFVDALENAFKPRSSHAGCFAAALLAAVAAVAGISLTQSRRDAKSGGGSGEAEPPPVASHAEFAESAEFGGGSVEAQPPPVASHAEFAESAELSRIGNVGSVAAAPSAAPSLSANDQTTQRPNDQTTQRPNDQTTQRPNDPTTKRPNDQTISLPPEGASLADLQAVRTALADERDSIADADPWSTEASPREAALQSAIEALDARITAALEAKEKATLEAEAKSIEEQRNARIAAAAAEQQIRNLKKGASLQERSVAAFRKWNDGEFKTQFEALDKAKAALDAISAASDLASAKERSAEIVTAAAWIAETAPVREEIDGIVRSIDAMKKDLDSAEASKYAQAKLGAADIARSDAGRLLARSRYEEAKAKYGDAKRLCDEALSSASAARASAKAKEQIALAEESKIRERWDDVIARADEALRYEPQNSTALALKREAQSEKQKLAAAKAEADRKAREEAERKAAERKAAEEARLAAERKAAEGRRSPDRRQDVAGGIGGLKTASPSSGSRGGATIDLGGGITLEMVNCPGVAPDIWMGKYEVTQEQWQRVMGSTPSYFGKKPKNPVETVSWNDCQKFVEKLNALPSVRSCGLSFRLPTEEEWETACRAGAPKSADYCKLADGTQITASNLSRVARYDKKWEDGPGPVGSLEPNAWGLYDMHGNVWEWTQTADGDLRVCRGGSFLDAADYCAAGIRNWSRPDSRCGSLGLRLAASGRAAK